MQRPGKPEEEAPGSGTLQTPDLEGDLWSLWDTLDGMGWPTEASAEAEAAMQLLPWTHPLEISTITSAMEQSNGFVTFSQPDGSPNPACQPVVVYNDITVTDQPPAAAALAVPHVEVCRPATPPAQPRPMQAPSLPGQASPSAAAMTNPVTTPAVTSGPPAWAEPGFLGGAQRAAANWVAAKVEPVPAQPPVQHAPALPRLQPAEMDPPKRRMDSTQRKKAKVAAMGSSVDLLLNRKAVLERELVDLLNRHEELSTDLPWHMQHEEVSFMASIASCMGPAAARQPPRTQPVQEPSPKLLQDLMLEPSATMTQLYKASGLFATKPLKENVVPSAATNGQNASPKQADKGAILWSSIVVFLRLSKAQKDDLAMAYSTHLAQVASLRGECLGIASKLQLMPQGERLLKPNLVTHLVCGQLSGIALHAEHLMQRLTEACCQVLNKVQLNNLRALAPAGASSFLALCQEITASRAQSGKAAPTKSTTKGTKSSAPPSKPSKTRSGATCSGHSTAQAPANIALADASGSADIIADILQAAAVPGDCAAAAEGNTPARPAQSQQACCPEAGLLAQGADAAATVFVTEVSPKQSKRKTPGSS